MEGLLLSYSSYNSTGVAEGAFVGIYVTTLIISIIASIVTIAATWAMFDKAGEPGWAAIVPIYNTYVMCKISTGSTLVFILMLIPFTSSFAAIYVLYKLSKSFGGSTIGAILTVLFSPIMLCIYGFGSAEYEGY